MAVSYVAIAFSVAVLGLLSALHALSPEFDPSWSVVSEYANGHFVGYANWLYVVVSCLWVIVAAKVALNYSSSLQSMDQAGLAPDPVSL